MVICLLGWGIAVSAYLLFWIPHEELQECHTLSCVVNKYKTIAVYAKLLIGILNIFASGFLIHVIKSAHTEKLKNRVVSVTMIMEISLDIIPVFLHQLLPLVKTTNALFYDIPLGSTFLAYVQLLSISALLLSIDRCLIISVPLQYKTIVSKLSPFVMSACIISSSIVVPLYYVFRVTKEERAVSRADSLARTETESSPVMNFWPPLFQAKEEKTKVKGW
ncbi:hypothetical protein DdX_17251 [Ditylenchus destructor]|uniref:Uncharacterized protein n=1 Tax=Ditylenchus destructor TaxID=166010 RepID=A0AAD4MMP3_9BILA|nr:hypothetical protein DdX_17251 [Ditylenchus destructor]